MPDARLERTRATLPSGYQFGDATLPSSLLNYIAERTKHCDSFGKAYYREAILTALYPWRAPHENAAGQLARHAGCLICDGRADALSE